MNLPPPHWPPRGWNSFDSFGAVADERAILDNLDVLVERLLPHGYDTHVLDIGWYRRYHREPGQRFPQVSEATLLGHELDDFGRYLPCPTMFPNGIKPLADACHERGVHFGIHLMRGIPRVAVERDLPISGAEGLRASDIADTSDVCPWCDDNFGVDMRRPGAQAYYDSVFRLLAEWGVDYVKVDDIVPYPREIRAVADAIARCGRPMRLSLSPGDLTCVAHLPDYRRANALRVTADVWDRRNDLAKGLDALQHWQGQERPDFAIDLDMIPFGALTVWRDHDAGMGERPLLYGKGVRRQSDFTPAQKRSFIVQRALAGSPLFMGGHLPETPEEDFELLTNPTILACQANATMATATARGDGWVALTVADRKHRNRGWLAVFNTTASPLQLLVSSRTFDLHANVALLDAWTNEQRSLPCEINLAEDDVGFARYER